MEVSHRQEGTIAYVQIVGHVDEKGAERLENYFQQLELSKLTEVVMDFSQVTRIGSAGIGQMLLLYKNLAMGGGTIRLEHVSHNLHELFKVLKLDTLFTITRN